MSPEGRFHWDNAVSESFFGQLKNDLGLATGLIQIGIRPVPLTTRKSRYCTNTLNCFTMRQRLHQTLGYIPPVEYEKRPLK